MHDRCVHENNSNPLYAASPAFRERYRWAAAAVKYLQPMISCTYTHIWFWYSCYRSSMVQSSSQPNFLFGHHYASMLFPISLPFFIAVFKDSLYTCIVEVYWYICLLLSLHVLYWFLKISQIIYPGNSNYIYISQELFSKAYDNVGVLFASIPNFTQFYSEDVNRGMECIRLLNEIIGKLTPGLFFLYDVCEHLQNTLRDKSLPSIFQHLSF